MKRFFVCVAFMGIIARLMLGCGTTGPPPVTFTTETLTIPIKTVPPGAKVTLDGSRVGITPLDLRIMYSSASRGYHPDEERPWKLRIEKEGYEPVEFSFVIRYRTYENFPEVITLKSTAPPGVSITGSAGALKRLTLGGPSECALDLSPDNRWLLVEIFEVGQGRSINRVLQKLDVFTGSKVLLTPQTSDSREASWLPDMSGFVFVSDRLGARTIVQSLGVSGETGVRFITQAFGGSARCPSVSPDGRDIAFHLEKLGGQSQLAVIGVDGTNLRMFGKGFRPSWAPDGQSIAFTQRVGENTHIYRVDSASGTNLMELTSGDYNDLTPVWSPDGKYIAFISDRVGDKKHLFLMLPNGQEVTQLTDGDFEISSICWGQDGFLYFSANPGGNWDIWRLQPRTE